MSWIKVTDQKSGKVIRDTRNEREDMFNLPTTKTAPNGAAKFTGAQIELIKNTIAKGATNDELQLFLYRCEHMGLDPLKPGEIHFVKYGNSPGTVVVGIEGFRKKAEATGKRSGITRGVTKDAQGNITHGWCEVYRSDWNQPAREEVSFSEYNTGNGSWKKMPETMIKKVAEAAALRMAFPDVLGGLYVHEEMDQAESGQASYARPVAPTTPPETMKYPPPVSYKPDIDLSSGTALIGSPVGSPPPPAWENPGQYVINFGKYKGKKIEEVPGHELTGYMGWCIDTANKKNQPLSRDAMSLKVNLDAFYGTPEDAAQANFDVPDFDSKETLPI